MFLNEVKMNIYSDGSTIGPNPSPKGGAWAVVAINEDQVVWEKSGLLTPKSTGLPSITNNFAELYGALIGLESMEKGWSGTLFTDSLVTLQRLKKPWRKGNGIPEYMVERIFKVYKKLGEFNVALVYGHPTKQELQDGFKKGIPVSKWNVWVDEICKQTKFHG